MNTGLSVRPACPEDAAAIQHLNRTALDYDFPLEETARRLAHVLARPDHRVYVAQCDGVVVGYVHAAGYDCLYAPPMKHVLAIAVDAAARGHGIGRALLAAVEDWAREEGAAGIRLTSGFNRGGAHRFYVTCGFWNRKEAKQFVKLLRPGWKPGDPA